ncbi:HNH endonuclease [Dyadobacter sp. CY347]|uniref:HNH endonuclease n=1 Tax=Dyadobacter sp. CY347 TaxID=2909336 RepID=UPI001F27CA6A|nr:HNH endonuclease [Dyadobacter sp. CY347]MCF2491133.1 HNH endonuclease [Dyadobacter sp. CY347]
MWNLDCLTKTNEELKNHLKVALTHVDGTVVYPITEPQQESVLELYRRYDANGGLPLAALRNPALAEPFLTALHNAYGQIQIGGRLKGLRDELIMLTSLCPYCGFGEITNLDHHLPRSLYNGLAIYHKNLVPCCGTCNNKKRTVDGAQADQQFHHIFFNTIPNDLIFFKATAELDAGSLSVIFEIQDIDGMPPETLDRLRFQVERLNLKERYISTINDFIISHKSSFEIMFEVRNSGADVKGFIDRSAISLGKEYGLNDWRPVLFRALAECNDFCNGGFASIGRKNIGL